MRQSPDQRHRREWLLHLFSNAVRRERGLMNLRAFSLALALSMIVIAGASAQTTTYNYAKLNFPGASSTSPAWINNNNEVVGTYVDSSNTTHGFKWQSGTFTKVDFPGAASTLPSGVNDGGVIVGTYTLANFETHGFKLQNGVFTTIDYPGFVGASGAVGINNSGTIVGNYGNSQGYILSSGTFKTLDAPQLNSGEVLDTELTGITNLGWITGRVFTGDFWRGFWYVNGEFDFLEKPYSLDNTVSGANGHGDIVGQAGSDCFISFAVESNESSESSEGFPNLHSLNLPQGADCPTSINYNRVIVGPSYLGTPASSGLTVKVTSPTNNSTDSNPVHIAATASGPNPISQMQVWVNYKEVFHVSGASLNANVTLPVGNNERFVVQALDSTGATAKVVETITVK
jgi:probable HAF family extracellular repeat protein